jgi:hypothetical protein
MKALLAAIGLLVGADWASAGLKTTKPGAAPQVVETLPPLNVVSERPAQPVAVPAKPPALPALDTSLPAWVPVEPLAPPALGAAKSNAPPAGGAPAASAGPNYALAQDPASPGPTSPPAQNTESTEGAGLGFVGGAGFYFIQPVFSSNPAFFQTRITTNAAGTASGTQTDTVDFNWNFQTAPRFWLGYVLNDAWMVRARYWQFAESSQGINLLHGADQPNVLTAVGTVGQLPFTATPLPAGAPADAITLASGLRLNVYDLEMAYSVETGHWWLQCSAGLRYAQLQQYYNASLFNPGNAALGFAAAARQQLEHSWFHGGGPALSGQAFYLLGCGFSLYVDGRGSLLFGRTQYGAAQNFTGGAPPEQSFTASSARDAFLPIGELELGVGWSIDLGRTHWLLKTGFLGQVWWDGGSASIPPGGIGVQSPAFSGNVIPLAATTSSNLGFYGWTFCLGVQF